MITLLVLTNLPDRASAERLADALVEKRLAACGFDASTDTAASLRRACERMLAAESATPLEETGLARPVSSDVMSSTAAPSKRACSRPSNGCAAVSWSASRSSRARGRYRSPLRAKNSPSPWRKIER